MEGTAERRRERQKEVEHEARDVAGARLEGHRQALGFVSSPAGGHRRRAWVCSLAERELEKRGGLRDARSI